MTILGILGSPHGLKGSTAVLLTAALNGAETAGAQVKLLNLATHRVGPCTACDTCHRTGRCPIHDDFNLFRDAMVEADGIILASPNYISSVTAQMKALFDRCCGLLHCQARAGRAVGHHPPD